MVLNVNSNDATVYILRHILAHQETLMHFAIEQHGERYLELFKKNFQDIENDLIEKFSIVDIKQDQ